MSVVDLEESEDHGFYVFLFKCLGDAQRYYLELLDSSYFNFAFGKKTIYHFFWVAGTESVFVF